MRFAIELSRKAAQVTQAMSDGVVTMLSGVNRYPPPRGTSGYLQIYSQSPWLRGAVGKVAYTVASVQWHVYAVRNDGPKFVKDTAIVRAGPRLRKALLKQRADAGKLTEIDDHPLIELLDYGCPLFNGTTIRKLLTAYYDLVGEGYLIKQRGENNLTIGMWPVPPTWITDLPSVDRPYYNVQFPGYVGQIPASEIVRVVDPDVANPYGRGKGVVQSLEDEIDIDEFASKHAKSFFHNNARPDLLIFGKGINKTTAERLEADWLEKNQGFFKAYRPYFLSGEIVGVHELTRDFESIQFNDLRKAQRDTIRQIIGVPPEVLGIVDQSNRATIDSAAYIMARYVTTPRLEMLRSAFQELANEFDDRIIVDYEEPVEEDREFKLRAAQAAPWSLNADEWRALSGHSDLGGKAGKIHLVPFNLSAVSSLGNLVGSAPSTPTIAPVPASTPTPTPSANGTEPMMEEESDLGKSFRKRIKQAMDVSEATDLDLLARLADTHEPRFSATFHRAASQAQSLTEFQALIDALRGGNVTAIEAAIALDAFDDELAALGIEVTAAAGSAATATADLLSQQLGINYSFDLSDPNMARWAEQYSSTMIRQISEETRTAVRELIRSGITDKVPPERLARGIIDVIGLDQRRAGAVQRFRQQLASEGVSVEVAERRVTRYAQQQLKQRGLTVARTETLSSLNNGRQASWNQAQRDGFLDANRTRKKWIVTDDDVLDTEICEPIPHMSQNKDLGLKDEFTTGNGNQVSQPPAHPNCRCTSGLYFKR